ncbi:MAG TPA: GrlR family regulatory protein [Oculatellaceae cyanobacterium]
MEGFYTTTFKTHTAVEGAGIVVMKNGKLIGGDNAYKYVGDYADHDGSLKVNVHATRFAPGVSVFGDVNELKLTFIANLTDTGACFKGTLIDEPEQQLVVTLCRQSEMI